ncbi:tetratricopeptide repeat protein [Flavobacterium amnicola]|uniref:histidine kinase n=1 Tax=Flavobacterium amnicola TaxID=2506422 RepID=A0A4Q1K3T8_9FLAO|nr:sensor histidine kinase [Flavobacterium amnicola]RXR19061.1 tetratricopeptide repeat protein [Flavobacterium amnicola]
MIKLLNAKKYSQYCDIALKRAQLFRDLNDSENALTILYEALKVAEFHNLPKHQILIHCKIGNVQIDAYNFSNSKKVAYKAKKIAHKLNDPEYIKNVNQVLYKLHTSIGSDSALYYLNKVAAYKSKSKDYKEISSNYNNYYTYYSSKKDYVNAKKNILEAVKYAKLTKDKKQISIIQMNLGVFHLQFDKNYAKAIEIFKEIIANEANNESSSMASTSYLNISYAYEMLGDYKTAMKYNNKYLEIQDVVINGRLEQASQEIETKYQISKIEDEYKHKNQELADKQRRNQRLLLLLGALFLLGIGLFYIFFQNLKLKQKNKLKDLDSDLQYKIISATLDGQDQERTKISEVLHDNVSATLSSVGLHLSAFESSLTPEQRSDLKKTRALLKQAHDKVRDLSHELVPPLLVKFGLQFALKDLCENNSNSLVKFNYHSELPKSKKFNHDFETKIFYFVSELFNNATKHSKATEVNLNLKEINGMLQIIVSDNGKGFNMKEKPFGFGLTQIRARVKNMNGNLKLFSKPDEGTIITITVKE